ncbi:ABC transporter permease subunit [bacterium]|nr:ABC transporter permease subunit [bacterium]
MIWTIVKKELQESLVSYKFIILTIACFVLIGFSNYSMYKTYKDNVEDYNLRTAIAGDVLLRKAPSALSIYVNGVQDLIERTFTYQKGGYEPEEATFGVNMDLYRDLFPVLDFAYVVKVILSFIAMIVGFDLLCGEKLRGTLRLMVSNSIPRNTIIFGKMIGNAITITIPFIIASLFYYILLQLMPDINFSFQDNLRLILIFGLSLLYLLIFLMAAIMISGLVSSPRLSIVTCFFVWITLVFLLPNILSLTAKKSEEIPNVKKISEAKWWASEEFKKESNQHPKGWVQEQTNEKRRKLTMDFRNKLLAYTNLAKKLNRFTPAGAYVLSSSNFAKYGMDDEHKFRNALFRFADEAKNNPGTRPAFTVIENSLGESLYNSIFDILSLILFAVLFYLGAYTVFLKYDVR